MSDLQTSLHMNKATIHLSISIVWSYECQLICNVQTINYYSPWKFSRVYYLFILL